MKHNREIAVQRWTLWRFLVILLAIVSAIESGIMVLLPHVLPRDTDDFVVTIVDVSVLATLCAPALWFGIFLPLQRAVVSQEARFKAIVETAVDGIITIDENGAILSSNSAGQRMFGYSASELLGRPLGTLIPSIECDKDSHALPGSFRIEETDARAYHPDSIGVHKSGGPFPVDVSIRETPGVGPRFFACTVRDLTEQRAAVNALTERAQLAALEKDVGMALTRSGTMREMLQDCCSALVLRMHAAFARVWTVNDAQQMLELQASAGLYTHIDGGHARVPIGKFKIGLIAQECNAHLTNDVLNDPRVGDHEWARREGMIAFAGHPLMISGRLVGVMALFARHSLSNVVLDALASVADAVALGIQRKCAESQLEAVHHQLVDASRRAGMAEVATSVLHNVGNVLNSVNVSASLAADRVRRSPVNDLVAVTEMIQGVPDPGAFISHDEKGKLVPQFLSELGRHLVDEQRTIVAELDSLTQNVEHIKEIVAAQQSYAKVTGMLEDVDASELVDVALDVSGAALSRHHVTVVRQYDQTPSFRADKHKLLQILVNLITNAKQALQGVAPEDRRLTLRIGRPPDAPGFVRIEVTDNGVGISAQAINRIFSLGFTTKKDGHGFGLHSAALTAKALGGSLTTQSEGAGKGAKFVLDIPLQPSAIGVS